MTCRKHIILRLVVVCLVVSVATIGLGGKCDKVKKKYVTVLPGVVPSEPTIISPADNATGVGCDVRLIWNAAGNASSYMVYFATSVPDLLTADPANTTGISLTYADYNTGSLLDYGTEYFWKVIAVNSEGTKVGNAWSFTTLDGYATELAAEMAVPRYKHNCVLMDDGKVLVASGTLSGGLELLRTAEIYDPATDTFAAVPSKQIDVNWRGMFAGRRGASGICEMGGTSGRYYFIAGFGPPEVYDSLNEEFLEVTAPADDGTYIGGWDNMC